MIRDKQQWLVESKANPLKLIKSFGSGTSHNQTKLVDIVIAGRKRRFYQKFYPHDEIAPIEAAALAIQKSFPLESIFVYQQSNGRLSLLTEEITFRSIHSLFATKNDRIVLETELSDIPERLLQSLADIFTYILILEDDDCHASNIGLNQSYDTLIHLDLDAILFLVRHQLRAQRCPDYSQKGCFDLSTTHINQLLKIDDAYPHYHPLMRSPIVSTSTNAYTTYTQAFFKKLIDDERFEAILIRRLITHAAQPLHIIEDYARAFGLESNADFVRYYQQRINKLAQACAHSIRIHSYFEQPGNIHRLQDDTSIDQTRLDTLIAPFAITKYQQMIAYTITELMPLIEQDHKHDNIYRGILTQLYNDIYHKKSYDDIVSEIQAGIDMLYPYHTQSAKVTQVKQDLEKLLTELELFNSNHYQLRIDSPCCTLESSVESWVEDFTCIHPDVVIIGLSEQCDQDTMGMSYICFNDDHEEWELIEPTATNSANLWQTRKTHETKPNGTLHSVP